MNYDRISIAKVESEIEKYAELHNKYPSVIEMCERDFDIFEKLVIKEWKEVGRIIEKVDKFRGCKIKITQYISKLKIR